MVKSIETEFAKLASSARVCITSVAAQFPTMKRYPLGERRSRLLVWIDNRIARIAIVYPASPLKLYLKLNT